MALDHRALGRLYSWLADEGEVSASPMARVPRPKVPVKPVPVLSDDQARRLVAYQAPKDRGRQTHEQARFNARRDAAMLRLARGTGPPRR